MKETIVANFYGGPGTGKSTMAALVFANLKDLGVNAELVTEYAKDQTWQESFNVLSNQIYVFAKQQHRLWRLKGKVDIILTDAPLLNSIVYCPSDGHALEELVKDEYNRFHNVDIFLNRVKAYNPSGRSQTEEQARVLDNKTKSVLYDVRRKTARFGNQSNDTLWYDLCLDGASYEADKIVNYLKNELEDV